MGNYQKISVGSFAFNKGKNTLGGTLATVIVKNTIGQLIKDVCVEIRPIGLERSKSNKSLFQKKVSLACGRCFFLDRGKKDVQYEILANDVPVKTVDIVQGNITIII